MNKRYIFFVLNHFFQILKLFLNSSTFALLTIIQFSWMGQEVYQEIFLAVLFETGKFLIILYRLINYLQRAYEAFSVTFTFMKLPLPSIQFSSHNSVGHFCMINQVMLVIKFIVIFNLKTVATFSSCIRYLGANVSC